MVRLSSEGSHSGKGTSKFPKIENCSRGPEFLAFGSPSSNDHRHLGMGHGTLHPAPTAQATRGNPGTSFQLQQQKCHSQAAGSKPQEHRGNSQSQPSSDSWSFNIFNNKLRRELPKSVEIYVFWREFLILVAHSFRPSSGTKLHCWKWE